MLTAVGFQCLMSVLEPLEKVMWITQSKNSFRRSGKLSSFLSVQKISPNCVYQSLWPLSFSVVHNFPLTQLQSQPHKIFVSRSILARFRQATWPSMEGSGPLVFYRKRRGVYGQDQRTYCPPPPPLPRP